ncbi:Panacea domain-containing protein [Adlercreutzia mucosicola]|uniref:Panacea domain-containing protein n=1 Tax=Adlercreutzia mucosicola TaxID=580026 RepID=UPI0005581CD7|nr:type II toxin-antitoxin system antitoxin SocA domain-containing protein [Adlercreutzia mucosicola]MCI9494489.1 DUF4065 domain-containing protein [Adlercreutzia mucosicola]MCR2035384.1 DUF4065 domain-containing protein [Adlercreutzia mucosicola]
MANIFDVAEFILNDLDTSSTMKLQKIIFYSHAYHLVHYGSPLVNSRVEAWANGPVFPELFSKHRHSFVVAHGHFAPYAPGEKLTTSEVVSIRRALQAFRSKTGSELSELTHSEVPWVKAREGLSPSARSHNEITNAAIRSFYAVGTGANPLFAAR